MPPPISRREALKTIGAAGAGLSLAPLTLRGQTAPIVVAGKPVEIAIASVSPATVRITIAALGSDRGPRDADFASRGGDPSATLARGQTPLALVPAAAGKPLQRARNAFAPVRAGNFTVRFTPAPPTLHITNEQDVAIQTLLLDTQSTSVSFALGKGPLLGFGEGGPQFDRKGQAYGTRNGQGGYQLRTHGGRVPIQWLVSTDGWGLFIHQPLGAFDLSGAMGRLKPTTEAPLDVFVTASADPKEIMRGSTTGSVWTQRRWRGFVADGVVESTAGLRGQVREEDVEAGL